MFSLWLWSERNHVLLPVTNDIYELTLNQANPIFTHKLNTFSLASMFLLRPNSSPVHIRG